MESVKTISPSLGLIETKITDFGLIHRADDDKEGKYNIKRRNI